MSVVNRRNAAPEVFWPARIRQNELAQVRLKQLYMLLMGVFLLEFLGRMAFYSLDDRTPVFVMIGYTVTAALGIWLGKSWKDKGFRLMSVYILWMILRCFISFREAPERTQAWDRILSLFWAVGGCYSFGRVFSKNEIKRFLGVVCLIWTVGMVLSSCLGIAAAWMRIRIPNFSGNAFWKIWGESSSARLNLIYCATVSGGMLSISILISLLAGIQARQKSLKVFFFIAVLPMTLALCLTDSRTAQISLSVGIASLFFVMIYYHLYSGYFKQRRIVSDSALFRGGSVFGLLVCSLLAGSIVFLILLNVNPLFDRLKINSTSLGILPSGAVTGDSVIRMAHRGLHTEDVLTGRDQIWKATYSFFMDHPRYLLYGASIVNSMARIVDQSLLDFSAGHGHNIMVQILVEGGLPAFLLFAGFLLYIFRKAVMLLHDRNNPVWMVLLPCLLLSMFIGDMGECLIWFGTKTVPMPFLIFLLAGIIASSSRTALPENRLKRVRVCMVFPAVCAILMLALSPFVLHHSAPVVHQDDYDDPAYDLFYECGDENCETHHGKHTIKTSGCGLCSISNAVRYMTGRGIDVRSLAEFARTNEQYIIHEGSKSTISEEAAKAFGDEFGFCFIGQISGLAEATAYVKQGCTVIAGVGNSIGGGHILVIADYDPLTKEYLILDSAGNYENWSRAFSSWQRITDNHLQSNPDVYFTSFRILAPSRLGNLALQPANDA